MNILIKILFSSIELCTATLLTFSLFRIPLRYNIIKAVIIAVILSSLSFYLRDIAKLVEYSVITVLICEVILIMTLLSLPFFYSVLMTVVGFLLGGLIEYTTVMIGVYLNITTVEQISTNVWHLVVLDTAVTILLIPIIFYLQSRKIGFMFIANRLTVKHALKGHNFILSSVLIASIFIIQLAQISFTHFNVHFFILLCLALIFLSGITAAYIQNKIILREKYERLKNR